MIIGNIPQTGIILFGSLRSVNSLSSKRPAAASVKNNDEAIPDHRRLPAGGGAVPVSMTGTVPSGRFGGHLDSPIVGDYLLECDK